ncbi:ABC transporter permease [Oribacterium sp. C9]|uniref:ABC transporter permease n=1 Tax=Oribacterium sp. C9 TaxID=1943579 RepID=UPI00098EA99E|nr:ABC transporter permease [Oribacterium sp. C9]OON84847.1 ABC transporter permease [Oribacterium sp. C9]
MSEKTKAALNILLSMLLALGAGAIVVALQGESPVEAYAALIRGAFNGKLKLGTTLAGVTPLLLTSLAFIVAAKAGAFHCGIEGCVFLGGIVAAYIGINWTFLPGPLQLIACFMGAMLVASLWSMIPGVLRIYFNVSEVCCTILMNSVALYITNYLVSGVMSAGTSLPQSADVDPHVRLTQFMKPSSANTGLFIAIIVTVFIMTLVYRTAFGFKLRQIGTNPANAEFAGTDPKKMFISAMMLAGSIGGIAGAIEVLGVHGFFLNNFASGLGTNGMLAALICKNNMFVAPLISFFIAVLKSGAMGMQQATSVPKSLVDTITAVFIIFACMNLIGDIKKNRDLKEGRT